MKKLGMRRTTLVVLGMAMLAACSSDAETRKAITVKNAATPGAGAPVKPDKEFSITLPMRSDSAGFGTRVAIEKGMVFASATGIANVSLGAIYSSTYGDAWSNPVSVASGNDWRFGRDMAVNNLNVVASSADTRSALFGWRNGGISVGAAPMNPGIIYSARPVGQFVSTESDWGRAVAMSTSYIAASAPLVGYYTTPSPVVVIMSATDAAANSAVVGPEGVDTNGSFGTALDMDDTTLVVGAEQTLSGRGSVFVYTRTGATWSLAQRLDGAAGEKFGSDVALVGARMVVGAPGTGLGAAYICERDGSTWSCPTKIDHPDPTVTGAPAFGAAVGIGSDGTEVIIGAPWDLGVTCCPGAAYTYELRTGTWTLDRTLEPTIPSNNDAFGFSVDIDAGVAVVGAPRADPDLGGPASSNAGTVSVFGVPRAAHRAVITSVSFDTPTIGAAVVARLTSVGNAAGGYTGSLEAWDRNGNRWRVTPNASSGSFTGMWPDASSFYGSLTAYNSNGYHVTALSGSIATPPATTTPATTSPATTSPATTSPATTTPATTSPIATSPIATLPIATLPIATLPTATLPAPAAPANTAPGALATSPSVATTPTMPGPVTLAPPAGSGVPLTTPLMSTVAPAVGTVAPVPADRSSDGTPSPTQSARSTETTSPYTTSIVAKCRVLRPCNVGVPALSGVDSATVRGAPNGLRFETRGAKLTGVAQKKGSFRVVITGRQNDKVGAVTVTLTVQ